MSEQGAYDLVSIIYNEGQPDQEWQVYTNDVKLLEKGVELNGRTWRELLEDERVASKRIESKGPFLHNPHLSSKLRRMAADLIWGAPSE